MHQSHGKQQILEAAPSLVPAQAKGGAPSLSIISFSRVLLLYARWLLSAFLCLQVLEQTSEWRSYSVRDWLSNGKKLAATKSGK
jgi:hypothetical protein